MLLTELTVCAPGSHLVAIGVSFASQASAGL